MTIGTELRDARERLGLSREQISTATKIQLHKIAALEQNAFDQLPSGIYLSGMAAAYAREVGLDADGLLRRLQAQVAPPPPVTLEEIAAARQSREAGLAGLQFSIAHGMTAFAVVALVLAGLSVGMHFYPLESLVEQEQSIAVAETAGMIPAPPAQALPERFFPQAVGTTGMAEADHVAPQPIEELLVVEAPSVPQPAAEATSTQVAEAPASTPLAASRPAQQPAAQAPPSHPEPLLEAERAAEAAPVASGANVAGAWRLETFVKSSSLKRFEGLRLGYRLVLRQVGDRVEGTGYKVSENGVSLAGGGQTPIALHGTIDDGRLKLAFGERGSRRESRGMFDLVVEDAGALRGRFESNAARSAGVVMGRRL